MKKILIIDDDDGIREALVFVLSDAGYEVMSLADGRKSIQTVKNYSPDVILLDLLMSGIDGRDICKQLKSNKKQKHIPIIMISAHPTARRAAMTAGAQAFLEKPFEIADMLQTIQKFV